MNEVMPSDSKHNIFLDPVRSDAEVLPYSRKAYCSPRLDSTWNGTYTHFVWSFLVIWNRDCTLFAVCLCLSPSPLPSLPSPRSPPRPPLPPFDKDNPSDIYETALEDDPRVWWNPASKVSATHNHTHSPNKSRDLDLISMLLWMPGSFRPLIQRSSTNRWQC